MKKSMIISLALVLTLAVSGFAYALWTQDMIINGTVNTASFDVHFEGSSSNDTGIDPDKAADVAGTAVSNSATSGEVEITNAYPGYNSTNTFEIHNNSSIAVKLSELLIENTNGVNLVVEPVAGCAALNDEIAANGTAFVIVKNTVGPDAPQSSALDYHIDIKAVQAQ